VKREQRKDILEAVGFGAVVASLIFVALEVRQNTSQMRAEAAYSVNEALQALNESQYEDPTLVDLLIRGEQDFYSLNAVDSARFTRYQLTRLNLCEYILGLENEGLPDVHIGYVDYIVREFRSKPGLSQWREMLGSSYVGSKEFWAKLRSP